MRARLCVAVFDENEIFRRGAVASIREDAALEIGDEGSRWMSVSCDVVVSCSTLLPGAEADKPIVVLRPPGRSVVPPRPDVYAVLAKRTLRPHQLVQAIHTAASGLRLASAVSRSDPSDERELAVLQQLAEGAATKEISSRLGYSERTIKQVISTAERRLGARNRAQLVATAMREGLI